jgi:hypothetical protein
MIDASTTPGSDDLNWFKSSYSGSEGGNCLELAYTWRKSSYSTEQGGNCLELATCPTAVHIRDSKVPDGSVLTVSSAAWESFTEFAKARRR